MRCGVGDACIDAAMGQRLRLLLVLMSRTVSARFTIRRRRDVLFRTDNAVSASTPLGGSPRSSVPACNLIDRCS